MNARILVVLSSLFLLACGSAGSAVVDPPTGSPPSAPGDSPAAVSSPNQVDPDPGPVGSNGEAGAPGDAGGDGGSSPDVVVPPLLGTETRTYDVAFVQGASDCRTFAGTAHLGVIVFLDHDGGTATVSIETWTGQAQASWNPSSGLLSVASTVFMVPSQAGPNALRLAGTWTLTPTTLSGSGTFSNQTCQDEPRIASGVIRSQP